MKSGYSLFPAQQVDFDGGNPTLGAFLVVVWLQRYWFVGVDGNIASSPPAMSTKKTQATCTTGLAASCMTGVGSPPCSKLSGKLVIA